MFTFLPFQLICRFFRVIQSSGFFIGWFPNNDFQSITADNLHVQFNISLGLTLFGSIESHTIFSKWIFLIRKLSFIDFQRIQVGLDCLECFWGCALVYISFTASFAPSFYVFPVRWWYIFVDQLLIYWLNGIYCWKWTGCFCCLELTSWLNPLFIWGWRNQVC